MRKLAHRTNRTRSRSSKSTSHIAPITSAMSTNSQNDSPGSRADYSTKGRGKVYDSILDTVGDTPMVKLTNVMKKLDLRANLYAKLEFFNPWSSVKDRLGLGMIESAEKEGRLIPGKSIIVEPTSGNTGISLAAIAAAKGYKCIICMPDSMSIERRKMLRFLGATLILTPASGGIKAAVESAERVVRENGGEPNAVMLQQFENPHNVTIHQNTTGQEVWNDLDGDVAAFVAGVGTGGTVTGSAAALKAHSPAVHILAVEPSDSPVLSGGKPGPHKIQGIGAGFIPSVYRSELIDEIMGIENDRAFEIAKLVSSSDGIPVGISSGATIAAAIELAKRPEYEGKNIAIICASCAERYMSTALFNGCE